jgi:hypothetical protein
MGDRGRLNAAVFVLHMAFVSARFRNSVMAAQTLRRCTAKSSGVYPGSSVRNGLQRLLTALFGESVPPSHTSSTGNFLAGPMWVGATSKPPSSWIERITHADQAKPNVAQRSRHATAHTRATSFSQALPLLVPCKVVCSSVAALPHPSSCACGPPGPHRGFPGRETRAERSRKSKHRLH